VKKITQEIKNKSIIFLANKEGRKPIAKT